jgi:spore maturation protein CgeB
VEPDPELAAELAYMGTYAPDRQPVLERFLLDVARSLPERRFLVAGPQYPDDPAWPANVRTCRTWRRRGTRRSTPARGWQLNATRADMVAAGWSPSVRLFEAAACGAAMISDRWPGIEDYFAPGREILLPESTDDVVDVLCHTHPDDRRAIGAAARARVLAEHTADRRAGELERLVSVPETVSGD